MTVHESSPAGAPTARIAAFVSDRAAADLDGEVIEATRRSILDTLAATYAGSRAQAGERMLEYATDAPSGGGTIVGAETEIAPEFAALVNGTTAHALDVDDGHRTASAHPGSAVVPAALGVAEREGASGEDLITAVAVGYEAMLTTASAVQTSHRERGFHATATTGCFGAAAAVASLLDLDERRSAHALGLAGTQAGGLFEFLEKGSMAKRFHPGRAAMAGVLAGDLAAVGFDGPDTIIEGEDGFATAFADDYDFAPYDDLGDPWAVTERYLKPYPSCRHAHAPIEAAFELRNRGVEPAAIDEVRVETYRSAAHHDKQAVETLLDAQMSIPFAVAVALATGEAKLAQFDPDLMDDDTIRELVEAVTVVETEEMESSYPATRPARVVAETTDGDTQEATVRYPTGSPESPMSWVGLQEKFHDLAGTSLDEAPRERVVDLLGDLESLESTRTLTDAL
ncbi:MAG: MmgE/PrpD family protein [Halanaeroarchaeum sp.]